MSPEQVDGKPVDYRSDIFSFGVVLYEMLSGRRAFPQRETLRETLHAVAAEDPPLLSELNPIALIYLSRTPKTQSLLRSSIVLPKGFGLDPNNSSLALSPDGRRLVFAAAGDDGKGQQLWLRSMDNLTMQPLAGTFGSTYPFWSPDGRYVGFFADQKLKKVEISSGLVQILCDAVNGRGASWSPQDMIVFAPQAFSSLFEVAAARLRRSALLDSPAGRTLMATSRLNFSSVLSCCRLSRKNRPRKN